jgi:heavy metal sensor kinase
LTFLPVAPPAYMTRRAAGGTWRFCTMENSEVTLAVGVSLARFDAEMARVRNGLLAALPAALLFIALGGWLVSRRALRSVEQLAHVAERVTASSLDERIPAEGADTEFRRLITVFNGMLDRLERSFSQASRFSADAAHELRTPLTILQGSIEQALQEAPAGSDQQRVYNNLLEEVQGLKEIVRKLLLLSLADAGKLELRPAPLNLSQAAEGVCEDLEALAPHLTVRRELQPALWVEADADLMAQALRNLATNAVKYNREGGWIEVRLTHDESAALLAVANTGDGIPPADRDRVFERFYRADPSRSRKVDGVGLGLSLAREIARAHGGDLRLEESGEDRTAFEMTLPLATDE